MGGGLPPLTLGQFACHRAWHAGARRPRPHRACVSLCPMTVAASMRFAAWRCCTMRIA